MPRIHPRGCCTLPHIIPIQSSPLALICHFQLPLPNPQLFLSLRRLNPPPAPVLASSVAALLDAPYISSHCYFSIKSILVRAKTHYCRRRFTSLLRPLLSAESTSSYAILGSNPDRRSRTTPLAFPPPLLLTSKPNSTTSTALLQFPTEVYLSHRDFSQRSSSHHSTHF